MGSKRIGESLRLKGAKSKRASSFWRMNPLKRRVKKDITKALKKVTKRELARDGRKRKKGLAKTSKQRFSAD